MTETVPERPSYDFDLDLATAAVQRLRDYLPFQQLVADGVVGTDANDAAPLAEKVEQAWLFQGLDRDGRPFRDPEGSGRCVVVLSERREWASANPHNTASFPALQMLIYADSSRLSDGAPWIRDADRKCKHVFKKLDPRFHNPSNQTEDRRWSYVEKIVHPDGAVEALPSKVIQVHSSLRGSPFTIGDVPGTNEYTVRGEVSYNMITD